MKLLRTSLKYLKWLILVLLVLNIENFAEFLGWDDLITNIFEAPEMVSFLFTPKATYIYLLALSFSLGVGLDGFLRKIEDKKNEMPLHEAFITLAPTIKNVGESLRGKVVRNGGMMITVDPDKVFKSSPELEPLRSVYSQISSLKIRTPVVPDSLTNAASNYHFEYLEGLENYSKSGSIKGAKVYVKRYLLPQTKLFKARKAIKDFWD